MSFRTPTEVDVENLASVCSTVILALALKPQNRGLLNDWNKFLKGVGAALQGLIELSNSKVKLF